jgi:hypothetical protein
MSDTKKWCVLTCVLYPVASVTQVPSLQIMPEGQRKISMAPNRKHKPA